MSETVDSGKDPSQRPAAALAIFPQAFLTASPSAAIQVYLNDAPAQKLVQFFQSKGLSALKEEDRNEEWYDDWLTYQAQRHIYADLLSPKAYSSRGAELNLLRLTRFLEIFGYCSPAHGYSLQVSFLGLFSILMGANSDLKREAVAALEAGGVFAFGVSERNHGSDLLSNEFAIAEIAPGRFIANGGKYYIGNANVAAIISVLARRENKRAAANSKRAPLALFALRPQSSQGIRNLRKIRTFGVRCAFVGEFEVKDHEFPETDLIAEGRRAWDAVLGTVAIGKFFLGFGQIGICERAWEEARTHLSGRILYGRRAIQIPHIRSAMTEAYVRLTAMKLYAYRALDYVQVSCADDRRYLLFTAIQKARVSTEGVRVVSLLSECIGARGFESATYFEMALRDAQLIPSLEGSSHINLGLTAQFVPAYFDDFDSAAAVPRSAFAGEVPASENPNLMEATMHGINTIRFRQFLESYRPFMSIRSVRLFVKQATAFRLFVRKARSRGKLLADTEAALAMGGCLATIAYGQLIAENSVCLRMPASMVSAIFAILVRDLCVLAIAVATLPALDDSERIRIRRLIVVPEPRGADWDFAVAQATDASE